MIRYSLEKQNEMHFTNNDYFNDFNNNVIFNAVAI